MKNQRKTGRVQAMVGQIPMRPWSEIEPDAKRMATSYYKNMDREWLRLVYGKGARKLTDVELRNRLVKRWVKEQQEQWSRDVSAGRPVTGMSNTKAEVSE